MTQEDAARSIEQPPVPVPTRVDTVRARVMFLLGFAYLLLVAGLIHRASSKSVTTWELEAMYTGVFTLWPVFCFEALWGIWRRHPSQRRGPVLKRALLVSIMPPWRMALADTRTGLIWIPRIGWQPPGKDLFKRVERAFGGPMLVFAFLILPILAFEYVRSEQVRELPTLALALDISIAVVWVAFATEFVFKASIHPKPLLFAKERWLDVAVVVIPMLEFILNQWAQAAMLSRLLRLSRALSPEQIARLQRLYRLQGLATKAWHAMLLLEGVSRLLGITPEKRLAQLEARIEELEEQLQEARAEAEAMRVRIAVREASGMKKQQRTAADNSDPDTLSPESATPPGPAIPTNIPPAH